MHYFNCFWQGALTGITLSLMLGTVFFSLIKNSIEFGYKSGIYIALGVVFCDSLYVLVALMSHSLSLFLKQYEFSLSIIGGTILIILGIFMLFQKKNNIDEGKIIKGKSKWYYFFNGFILNLVNPVNFLTVFGISNMLTIRFNYTIIDQIIYFGAMMLTIIATEVGISISASKIKSYITPTIMNRINQLSGIIFLIIGFKLGFGKFL